MDKELSIAGCLLLIFTVFTLVTPVSASHDITPLLALEHAHPSTPITCATSRQLLELSKHQQNHVRYNCERKITIREAVEAMEGAEIYYDDPQRDGFLVRFPGKLIFPNGVAILPLEAKPVLYRFASVLNSNGYDNAVHVRGHASTPDISTTEFSSNQELSEVRAKLVGEHLVFKNGVSPDRISTEGFGEQRLYNEEINDATERLNRRVDFFIEN